MIDTAVAAELVDCSLYERGVRKLLLGLGGLLVPCVLLVAWFRRGGYAGPVFRGEG
jgi:hypothetical protein